jgi:azurin
LYKFNEITPENAPNIVGKEIVFESQIGLFQNSHTHGVVLAHGNQIDGYSLYFSKDMILHFQVYQNGVRYAIKTPKPVALMQFNILARLEQGGNLFLQVGGQDPVRGRAAGLFAKPIREAIRVGFDKDNYSPAGNYEVIRLGGGLSNTRLRISVPKVMNKAQKSSTGNIDQRILVKTIPHQLKYDKTLIVVKAGSMVELVLQNADEMPHNLIIIKPGSLQRVGAEADRIARDVNAAKINFVPQLPEVLFSTKLVEFGESYTLSFRVPKEPGDYPFLCTYPGHWRVMNGILRVRK